MRHALLSAAALLAAGPALAADLPRRAEPPPFVPAPIFTWTGFYGGVNAGYVFSGNQYIITRGNNGSGAGALEPPALTDTVNNVATGRRAPSLRSVSEGFSGGGQAGYNFQFTPGSGIVVGVEADVAYTDLNKRQRYTSALNDPSTFQQNLDFLGTVRGRVGYAFDRFLIYGTGGFAFGSANNQVRFLSNNVAAGNPLAYSGGYDDIETGYAWGGGIEGVVANPALLNPFNFATVTAKIEYLHYDLGRRSVLVDATGIAPVTGSYTSSFKTEGNLIRAGLNYKFNGF